VFALIAMFVFSPVHADLINNGNNLVYDNDLNITWYVPDLGSMTWSQAMTWAENLEVGTATDWRLPTLSYQDKNGDGKITVDEVFFSEMRNLYYELGNTEGGPLSNTGPFAYLTASNYWTDKAHPSAPTIRHFAFSFSTGGHGYGAESTGYADHFLVMAVHQGNIASASETPIPGAILLFAPGLAFIAILRKKLTAK